MGCYLSFFLDFFVSKVDDVTCKRGMYGTVATSSIKYTIVYMQYLTMQICAYA